MTTIYDPRAARAYAKGEAAKAKAEADAHRAEIARADRAAAAEESRIERAQRREQRQQTWTRWRSAAPDTALSALWAAVIVAPLLLAWNAQAAFARETLQIPASMAWLFPLAIEAGAWVCAFEAHRRSQRGAPVGALPRWMWTLAGIAAAINLAHGTADFGPVAGLALAVLSLLGVLLHHIRQNLNAAEATGTRPRRIAQPWLRWALFPRLALTAARIAVRADYSPAEAWEAAWIDRHGIGPRASKRDRRLARVIVRQQNTADRKAAKEGAFTIINGVILRTTLPALTVAEPAPAEPSYTPVERRELSAQAAELLPKVKAAIASGELPERPSAYRINKQFKGGMPAAQEVRDALNPVHPVGESEAA